MRIWIFGDSFAANTSKDSWSVLLGDNVINLASNGSSEYRIWKTYQKHKLNINPHDKVIFCHTSWSRVYLKDEQTLWSRMLPSHPVCDLILSDIYAKKENKFISILKKIWDDNYFKDTYDLMYSDLRRVPNSIHISFFDNPVYKSIWEQHPGKINHLSVYGNTLVHESVTNRLK